MKKSKSFTIIELIAVIVIIGIIFIISIPQIQKTSLNSKIKLCQNKLSVIEDSLNLFLSTNHDCYDNDESDCYICTETTNNKCITNVEMLAKLGIVESDNDTDVINPINKTKINDYKIMVKYDYDSKNFISNFLNIENEDIDSNYSSICKSNKNGIKEGEENPSFRLSKKYKVYLIKDGVLDEGSTKGTHKIYIAKLASFCEQANDNEQYAFTKYEEKNENDNLYLYCYFETKPNPTLKINISDEDSVKISNITSSKACDKLNQYEYSCYPNQKIEITYELTTGDVNIENISCSPNVCEKDLINNKITIDMKYDNVLVKIDTDSKYRLDYYIDDPNGSDNSYQDYSSIIPSTYVNTRAEAEKLCQENLDDNIINSKTDVDKVYNKKIYRCKYNRKKFEIKLKTDDYILNSNVLNGAVYKYGQTVNLNFTFSEGYYFGNIDYANTTLTKENISILDDIFSTEKENDTNIITFTMPSNDVNLSIISGKKYNMTVYDHYQDADSGSSYSTDVGKSNVFAVIPLDEKIDINQFCKYNKDENIYTLNSSDNYYVKDKKEINCYYDRTLKTVTFDKTKTNDKIDSISISPNSYNLYNYNKISEAKVENHQYRYGQNIIMRIDSYAQDYEYNGVDCSISDNCIIGLDGTTKIKANNDMTVTPKANDIVEEFKVYNHYQNADNLDGYTTELIKDEEEVTLSNGDKDNSKIVCEKYGNTKDETFKYNNVNSYLVRDKKEINCYYDRNLKTVTFNKTDDKIKSISISPNSYNLYNYNKLSENKDENHQYRYGQNIIMRIDSYEQDYEYNGVDCSVSENCIIGLDGTTKIKANSNMTVTPKANDIVEEFKVYNHYQNADNLDGYTTELIKDEEEVTLSNGDKDNSKIVCEKYGNTKDETFKYNNVNSYLVRDKKEINCYYDRKPVALTYNIDSNISSFGYIPANNNTISIGTDNNIVEYRYGQNIILKIKEYNTGYIFDNFICNGSGTCICANDVIKINITGGLTVTVNAKKESE